MGDFKKQELLSKEFSKIRKSVKARVLRKNQKEIVADVVQRLTNLSGAERKRELKRLRGAGAINEAIERVVLQRLRRVR